MTTDFTTLRILLECRHRVKFWGAHYFIKPRLISRMFGDGKKLFIIQPLDTRPNYYYIRVDSTWGTSNWNHDDGIKEPAEWLEDVLQAIDEDFGNTADGGMENCGFPVQSDGSGHCWEECDWPKQIADADRRIELMRYFRNTSDLSAVLP